jgi:hypothetical protein
MTDGHFALPFTPEDLQLRSVEDVALQLRVSRAFVRLCIACGCPTRGARLSAAELLHWLFENYQVLRAHCGLLPMVEIDGVDAEAGRRLRMGNAVLTLLEFGASRVTNVVEKIQLLEVRDLVEQALDCA